MNGERRPPPLGGEGRGDLKMTKCVVETTQNTCISRLHAFLDLGGSEISLPSSSHSGGGWRGQREGTERACVCMCKVVG